MRLNLLKKLVMVSVLAISIALAGVVSVAGAMVPKPEPTVGSTSIPLKSIPYPCHVNVGSDSRFIACTYGPEHAKYRVLLLGDSHMRMYFPPIYRLAYQYGWQLTSVSKSACQIASPKLKPTNIIGSCWNWNKMRESWLGEQKPFDLTITTSDSTMTFSRANSDISFKDALELITNKAKQVIVIRDDPKGIDGVDVCLNDLSRAAKGECDNTYVNAMHRADTLANIAIGYPGVTLLDMTDAYCDATTCRAYIDGIKVYNNPSHISKEFSLTLQDRILQAVPKRLK